MSQSTRTTDAVFDHHLEAVLAGDLEAILSDYDRSAVVIVNGQTRRGWDELRSVFTELFRALPGAQLTVRRRVTEGEILYLEWRADGPGITVPDGTDTFVIREGLIQYQTVRFTPPAG